MVSCSCNRYAAVNAHIATSPRLISATGQMNRNRAPIIATPRRVGRQSHPPTERPPSLVRREPGWLPDDHPQPAPAFPGTQTGPYIWETRLDSPGTWVASYREPGPSPTPTTT